METVVHMPLVYGAIGYSLMYLLLGGGFVGAAVIYVAARALGR
jgi:hypothetical protein